ncbi:hypothetical protein VTL71DRAFT_9153 [Oculimacula yallundae]|uniref:Cupin type-1 domain-containing protein n=1 Tax=Oculimacula yallundae TaxID=86028 RepID=A0ABR4BV57_9HELO
MSSSKTQNQKHRLELTPITYLQVSKHQIPRYNLIPNTSIQKRPLLIYHSCFPVSASAASIEDHLISVGVVVPQWRYTMYDITHFHSTTHEVLCVCSGRAKLCFGHESNPHSLTLTVQKGDVIIIPAGVGHRLMDDFQSGFELVGSYPRGMYCDMCCGKKGEAGKVEGIERLKWFERDPVYGDEGPLVDAGG